MIDLLLTNLLIVLALLSGLWLISVLLRDAGIVDIFWGLGFIAIAWSSWIQGSSKGFDANEVQLGPAEPFLSANLLLVGLVTVWGVRLATYLAWRNWGQPEDHRYAAMRHRGGTAFWWKSLLTVFWLQGGIMWIVSLPLQFCAASAITSINVWHIPGVLFWIIGMAFEAGGDWQLARFKSNPQNQGQILETGFWKVTRHPNYFGDFMVWWGFYLIAVNSGAPVWTAIGPAIMSFFLMFVSGVAMTERSMKRSKPAYADYIRRTNAFFPGPPRAS